jgi:signal transduction histidine kinase
MRRRIIVCLALLLGLCLAGDAIALWCLNTSIAELSTLADSHRVQVMRADLASSGVRIQTDVMNVRAGNPPDYARQIENVGRFGRSLGTCGSCHHAPGVQQQLDSLAAHFRRYESLAKAMQAAPTPAAAEALEPEAVAAADVLTRESTDMAECAHLRVQARSSEAAASVRYAWLTLCGTLVATLIAGGLVAFHLHRRLTRPVQSLLDGIEQVRHGHLDHRFHIDGDAEFRAVGQALEEANRCLRNAQDGVLQAEKLAAVGRMAAGVAHEVSNPLASIASVAQMMKRDCHDPKHAEWVGLIMQHVSRVSQIVRELLTFARPAPDQQRARINLSSVLDNAVALLRYDRRVGQAQIACEYDRDLVLESGNADRLLLVFTNIMINSFDALADCRNGDAQVTIRSHNLGDQIVVQVSDNGPGMAEEQIANAFDPFFTTKQPGAGTGLGLWVCYQVVSSHGGVIRIQSHLGEGTTVVVELPRCRGTGGVTGSRTFPGQHEFLGVPPAASEAPVAT